MKNLMMLLIIFVLGMIGCEKQNLLIPDKPDIAYGPGDVIPTPRIPGYGSIVVSFTQEAADSIEAIRLSNPIIMDVDTLNFIANEVVVGILKPDQFGVNPDCFGPNSVTIISLFGDEFLDSVHITVVDNYYDTVWKATVMPVVDSCIHVEFGVQGIYPQ